MAYEMRSNNPLFNTATFQDAGAYDAAPANVMTVQGTALKALALSVLVFTAAAWSWNQVLEGGISPGFIIGTAIGGAVVAFITVMKPSIAGWTAPVYAVLEGLCLGAISVFFEKTRYPGIAIQAVGLTGGTLLIMLTLYATRTIRVTEKLTGAIVAATGALALFYLLTMILRLFSIQIPYIHSSGPIGIGFSLFVVGLAAFNLLLDFDAIEQGSNRGAPKNMEWYAAFGLLVTLVWLYIEILNLLRKLSDRR
ncbi:MAG: Bax inhibitor-1/YccA family protein [Isosphaeraceae bacterium]|nr:Bax inhibitor-1/YccA family protein [Isosphaeraceae bacterium]